MKQHPILLSQHEARAARDGRLTQVRRAMKPQPVLENGRMAWRPKSAKLTGNAALDQAVGTQPCAVWNPDIPVMESGAAEIVELAPYKVGDQLWGRETFLLLRSGHYHGIGPRERILNHCGRTVVNGVEYKADDNGSEETTRCRMELGYTRYSPSTQMPQWAARTWFEVVGVRAERLQDISRGDAMAEGCPYPNMAKGPNPRYWFAGVWTQINGIGSWEANPWVWVIALKRIEVPA
jgi:hypothetical protein